MAWCGIGFGTGMADADFLVFHSDDVGQVKVEELASMGRGAQPVGRMRNETLINIVSANRAGGVLGVELLRKNTGPIGRNFVSLNGFTGIIYAFHPGPRVLDPSGGYGWFLFHGLGNW